MKASQIIILVLVALIALALCVLAAILIFRPGGEAAPTPEPSVTPETGVGGAWQRIQAAGKIVVGTSADYPPFEYYTDDYQIDGFDVALMNEIGRRLGLQVEFQNFSFDGLGDALYLNQIDVAIAAISVTSEREAQVDFSNIYFVGEDGIIARADSNIVLSAVDDLAQYKVGTQRASVFDDWLQEELVDTGKMPRSNLFEYERAGDAVRDLTEGRVDLVILDAQPAEVAVTEAGVKLVARGLNQQRFAVALPKGESELKSEIDRVLTDLSNEGFVAQLAKLYLNLEPGQIPPTPTPTPQPEATSTPAPPPACRDGLALVEHLNYDDQGVTAPPVFNPGQPFVKQWRVKNTGTCTWDTNYRIEYAHGNVPAARMGGEPTNVTRPVAPGETYDISLDLVAPLKAGTYQAFWEMHNAAGVSFGERLPVSARVNPAATVTPAPTQTPVPGITFTVDRNQIKQGECVNFYWKIENAKAVYFYHEGENWQDKGVTGEETRRECPPATLTYYLKVIWTDNSEETRGITVYVEPTTEAPYIKRFTVDPPDQITLGQCVTVRWDVEGQVTRITLTTDNRMLWDGAPNQGSYQDCPPSAGVVGYHFVAEGPGGRSEAHHNINVVGEATATPAPTPAPEAPVIYSLSVTPDQVQLGGCFSISWATGGGTTWVNIYRNEDSVWDDAPSKGSLQDCPTEAGPVTYGVEAYNAVDETVWQDKTVQVVQ